MNNPEIEPQIRRGGSAFCGNNLQAHYPHCRQSDRDNLKVVSLSEWCARNFITKRVGRTLIKKKLLLSFRRHHQWWVAVNPACLDELLEYLGVEELMFDISQG